MNFTVVGDTVNIAQRFEQLGKDFMVAGEEIVVLASGSTMAAVKNRNRWASAPSSPCCATSRATNQPVAVYRLA